jgi:hypothetical protein
MIFYDIILFFVSDACIPTLCQFWNKCIVLNAAKSSAREILFQDFKR